MKTAEEILLKSAYREDLADDDDYTVHCSTAIKAMTEYASQEKSALQDHADRLAALIEEAKTIPAFSLSDLGPALRDSGWFNRLNEALSAHKQMKGQ